MSASAGGRGAATEPTVDLDRLTEVKLRIAASPHLRTSHSTPRIMWNVVGSLVPILDSLRDAAGAC